MATAPPSPPAVTGVAAEVARYRSAMRLSPDGRYWWDGTTWRDAERVAPPLVTRSPDNRYWWDGAGWRVNLVSGTAGPNGFAIASLVLGILWVFWIGSVLAVIFGHVALNQVHRTDESGRGMAIAGLVLGYVGIAFFLAFVIAASITVGHTGSLHVQVGGGYAAP